MSLEHQPIGLEPGAIVDGRYRVEETIGGGAMSSVYRATRLKDGKAVAIKMLHPWLSDERREVDRLFREAKTIKSLEHPGCVRLLDWGMGGELPYLVLELVNGISLQTAMTRIGKFPVERATLIGVQVCHVLTAAHQLGIIHRDLKPDNIMLCDGERDVVKVLDFGLARMLPHHRTAEETIPRELTQPGSILGTLSHMAPEIAGVQGKADARSDIYSLGVILYEMLTGVLPLEGATQIATLMMVTTVVPPHLREHAPELHPNLDRIVMRCLEKKPRDRFQSASDIAAVLLTLQGSPKGDAIGHTVTTLLPLEDDDETVLRTVSEEDLSEVSAPKPAPIEPPAAVDPVPPTAAVQAQPRGGISIGLAVFAFVIAVAIGVLLVLVLVRT